MSYFSVTGSRESIGIAALRGELAIDIAKIAKGILARGAATQQGVLATSSSHDKSSHDQMTGGVMREATLTLPYGIKGEEDDGEYIVEVDQLELKCEFE